MIYLFVSLLCAVYVCVCADVCVPTCVSREGFQVSCSLTLCLVSFLDMGILTEPGAKMATIMPGLLLLPTALWWQCQEQIQILALT